MLYGYRGLVAGAALGDEVFGLGMKFSSVSDCGAEGIGLEHMVEGGDP